MNKPFKREQVEAEALAYFNGDELASTVWINKYALKDSEGNIYESNPDMMHRRIAKEFARIEAKYKKPVSEETIYNLIKDFKYIIPQGSPMFGIGNNLQTISLSNCFVIGNTSDSYGGIMETDQEQVQLMKRRGGVGHDLSHFRAKGQKVNNSALTSTGVVPYMERFSNSTREVAQDGRRGALMLSISTDHKDALDFANAKLEADKITGANISLKATDRFMKSVLRPIKDSKGQYKIDKELWDTVIHNSWKSAEPAFLFWDTIIKESIPSVYGDDWKETSTNPCGEIPLCPYDSCRLIAVNLYSFVDNPFTNHATFNWGKFEAYVTIAQRMMDDMVDLEIEKIDAILAKIEIDPEPENIKSVERNLWQKIRNKAVNGRRTGLGITGAGDMLAGMGYRYGSLEGNQFAENVQMYFKIHAYTSSKIMGEERGSFPIFNPELEKDNPFINRLENQNAYKNTARRNISLLTIAPTGTTSLMAQVSSGIENVFMISYKRRKKINPNEGDTADFVDQNGDQWKEFNVFHKHFITWYNIKARLNSISKAKEILEGCSDEDLQRVIKESPYYKSTAADLDWVAKVTMQGMVQKHIDHSISVTVNLPEDATEDVVRAVFTEGWKSGCKGITVYREGSRTGVLVSKDEKVTVKDNHATKRPKSLDAVVIPFQNNHEKWVAIVGLMSNRPYEIFVGKMQDSLVEFVKTEKQVSIVKEKDGKDSKYFAKFNGTKIEVSGVFNPEFHNYARLISGLMRHNMPLNNVYDVVRGLNMDNDSLNSWKSGVARIIKRFITDGTKSKETCPNCGAEDSMVFVEGCETCQSCGTGKCG